MRRRGVSNLDQERNKEEEIGVRGPPIEARERGLNVKRFLDLSKLWSKSEGVNEKADMGLE